MFWTVVLKRVAFFFFFQQAPKPKKRRKDRVEVNQNSCYLLIDVVLFRTFVHYRKSYASLQFHSLVRVYFICAATKIKTTLIACDFRGFFIGLNQCVMRA